MSDSRKRCSLKDFQTREMSAPQAGASGETCRALRCEETHSSLLPTTEARYGIDKSIDRIWSEAARLLPAGTAIASLAYRMRKH